MSTEGFVKFLHEMGHTVRREGGAYWYNSSPRIYMSFPFQLEIDPKSLDIRNVIGRDGFAARFPCAPNVGRPSYRLVCDTPDYGLSSLSQKARNQTKRGLERCEVRPVESDKLLTHGIRLNRDTMERQGRKIAKGFDEYWMKYFSAAMKAEGADIWGAFVEGELAAYLVSFRMNRCAHILIVRSDSRHLNVYPNNALLFNYIRQTLGRGDVEQVSIGFESLQQRLESLDHFKSGLGFRKVETGQRIELAWWLKLFLRKPLAARLCGLIHSKAAKDERFAKLSGMLQWYSKQPELFR